MNPNERTSTNPVAPCHTEQDCRQQPWCRINGKCQRAAGVPEVAPQHSTKENGDCPHWCEACAAEAAARGVVGINGLTEAETSATASVMGIVGVTAVAPAQPTLLDYDEIEAIVAEVRAKYPNSQQAAHYAADRAQRAVLARNAGVSPVDEKTKER